MCSLYRFQTIQEFSEVIFLLLRAGRCKILLRETKETQRNYCLAEPICNPMGKDRCKRTNRRNILRPKIALLYRHHHVNGPDIHMPVHITDTWSLLIEPKKHNLWLGAAEQTPVLVAP